MRVLVIEDSVRLQRTLGTALRKSGYAVDLSGDGEEGLWLANSNNYDVIVLDLMLPKLDGLSVLADIPQLFERFWRKETARTGGQHMGLGLPLARVFAEVMGWKLTAVMSSPAVLTVTLVQTADGPSIQAI